MAPISTPTSLHGGHPALPNSYVEICLVCIPGPQCTLFAPHICLIFRLLIRISILTFAPRKGLKRAEEHRNTCRALESEILRVSPGMLAWRLPKSSGSVVLSRCDFICDAIRLYRASPRLLSRCHRRLRTRCSCMAAESAEDYAQSMGH